MEEFKNRVEAILFTTGRFIALEELAGLCEVGSVGILRDALEALQEEYVKRAGALQVVCEDNKWRIMLRKEYLYLTEKLLTDTELDKATQETLAIIAYKTPAIQSEVIKIRGNGAYDHIRTLKEMGLVTAEKFGRTRILRVTPKFYDYFDVVVDKFQETVAAAERKTDETE